MKELQKQTESREIPEQTMGYLGPRGNFTHIAIHEYARVHQDATLIPVEAKSISEMIHSLRDTTTESAIVPTDNSTDGNVKDTLREILRGGLYITGEQIVPVSLSLVKQKNADIQTISSKDTALRQASTWISQTYPNANLVPVNSTGEAIRMASEDPTVAGIGSSISAVEQGLDMSKLDQIDNIQDNKANATRFAILETHLKLPDVNEPDIKSSLIIKTKKDQPGQLLSYVQAFSGEKINLTRIKSFPNPDEPETLCFWLDIDEHWLSENTQSALRSIYELNGGTEIQLLGSYKKSDYEIPETDEELSISHELLERIKKEELLEGETISENELVLAFALPNTAGALQHALEPIGNHGLNMKRIGSITSPRGHLDEYVFYVGIDTTRVSSETLQTLYEDMEKTSEVLTQLQTPKESDSVLIEQVDLLQQKVLEAKNNPGSLDELNAILELQQFIKDNPASAKYLHK